MSMSVVYLFGARGGGGRRNLSRVLLSLCCRCAVVAIVFGGLLCPRPAVPRPLCGDAPPPRWPVGFVSQLLLLPFRFLLCSCLVVVSSFAAFTIHSFSSAAVPAVVSRATPVTHTHTLYNCYTTHVCRLVW